MLIRSTGDARIDAIVEFEIRYNQTRWAEVWLAVIMTGISVVFLDGLLFPLSHGYDFIAQFVTEKQAGLIGVFVGVGRLFALWVNGSKKRSPWFRIVGCVGGGFFWGALGWGFMVQELPNDATSILVPIFLGLFAAEVHSSARAARDAVVYWRYKEMRTPGDAFLVTA